MVEHERRRGPVDRVVDQRQPADVAHDGRRSRRRLMGQHRPRGVDRERASSRGDEPTGDRPRAGTHVQHQPAGHRGCARQQRIGQRPVHQLRAVGPRRGGALVALPGHTQAVGGGHGSHARALATWADPPVQLVGITERLLPGEGRHHRDDRQAQLPLEPAARVDSGSLQPRPVGLDRRLLRDRQPLPVERHIPEQVVQARRLAGVGLVDQDGAPVGVAAEVAHLPVAGHERGGSLGQGIDQPRRVLVDPPDEAAQLRMAAGQPLPPGVSGGDRSRNLRRPSARGR